MCLFATGFFKDPAPHFLCLFLSFFFLGKGGQSFAKGQKHVGCIKG